LNSTPAIFVRIHPLFNDRCCLLFQHEMLPTPTKLHYRFGTRDLSRVWQGMTLATANVVYDAVGVSLRRKHLCCRVIADGYMQIDA